LKLLLPGSFTTPQFSATPSPDGTAITVACFVEGTRILTDTANRAAFAIGDPVRAKQHA